MTALLLLLAAQASEPDLYGLGAVNMGRAGASTAIADDAWSAYYNPAGLARLHQITLQIGWVGAQADLMPFNQIVFDVDGDGSTSDANGFAQMGPVGTDYNVRATGPARPLTTDGLQVALGYPIGPYVGIGIAAFVPREGLLRIQTQDPAIPYYVMYRNRNNRFAIHPAIAVQPVEGLSLGLGAQVAAKLKLSAEVAVGANIDAFSSEDGSPDLQGDVNLQIRHVEAIAPPQVTPVAGLHLTAGAFVPRSKPQLKHDLNQIALGVTYRGSWGVNTTADITAGVHGKVTFDDKTVLLDDVITAPIQVSIADLVAFYNPEQVAIGFAAGHQPCDMCGGFSASFDATWTNWSAFQELTIPSTTVDVDAIAGTHFSVALGAELPPPAFTDTWNLRGGLDTTLPLVDDKNLGRVSLRARGGYAFIPTPVPDQTGLTNYVDNDKHIGAFGLGFELSRIPKVAKGPVRFDLAVQTQSLVQRETVKADGLVTDTDGDGRLNYPSGYPFAGRYTSGGRTWGMMATLELRFGNPTQIPAPKIPSHRKKSGANP